METFSPETKWHRFILTADLESAMDPPKTEQEVVGLNKTSIAPLIVK